MFRKLYSKAFFRVPLKFAFTFIATKLVMDWSHYMLLGTQMKIPRTMHMFGAQNSMNAPLQMPYPYADTYEHLQKIKEYNEFQNKQFTSVYLRQQIKKHLYNDLPCRQNPHSIDHFIEYGNTNRIKQYINYTFINKLKSQGIQIPEGINQKIRQLEQYKLQFHRPIVPVL